MTDDVKMKRTYGLAVVTVFLLILVLGTNSSADAIGIEYSLDSQGLEITSKRAAPGLRNREADKEKQ